MIYMTQCLPNTKCHPVNISKTRIFFSWKKDQVIFFQPWKVWSFSLFFFLLPLWMDQSHDPWPHLFRGKNPIHRSHNLPFRGAIYIELHYIFNSVPVLGGLKWAMKKTGPWWFKYVHPRKLSCPLKMDYFSREYIFQPLIFRGYVGFQGCRGLYYHLLWGL